MIVKAPPSAKEECDVECTHCRLPVPAGLIDSTSDDQFCCRGCEGAYQLIHATGLESFYAMARSQSDAMTLKDRTTQASRFAEFDSELFLETFTQPSKDGNRQIKLALEGIHCAACIWLIEKLPSIESGVLDARVNWSRGTVKLTWQVDHVDLSKIACTLHQLGYTPHPIHESEKEKRFHRENRKHLSRLGISAALAGNNMIVSAALYFGMFAHMTAGMNTLMRAASCLIGLTALLFPGRLFIQSAIQAIRTRTPHMDLPIALALLVGTVVGTINVVRGTGEIYFDSLSVLIFLLLVGRWLQFRQQSRAADAVEMLYRMTPKTARKIVDGVEVESLVDLLNVGDVVEVRSGEVIPVDGVVRSGNALIDESILTGESAPIVKSTDDVVFAGTLSTSSSLRIETTQTGDATRLSKIAQLVEDSGEHRPQVVQWANRIGGYFVVTVLVLAAVTFAFWCRISIEVAVDRTMALLIVACPCALALATPLAIAVALGRAAKAGIMVKSGDVLQSLQKPGMIWLDKTGTLTEGVLKVESWHGDRSCLPLVSMIESRSQHPVGRALVRYASEYPQHSVGESKGGNGRDFRGTNEYSAIDIQEHFGFGIQALVSGKKVLIGTLEFLQHHPTNITARDRHVAEQMLVQGFSPCWVAIDGQVQAIAAIGDAIRPEAYDAIQQFITHGWRVGILSGDHQEVVERVAKRLGVSQEMAKGSLLPEEKLNVIKQSSAPTVVMVGDGVNDSASLAAASVGIAVKGGAEACLAAAPVYLARPGLLPILDLLQLSKSTTRTMKRNLAVSLAYNLSFAALAFSGLINPFVAAILMPISSLTVVTLSIGFGSARMTFQERK